MRATRTPAAKLAPDRSGRGRRARRPAGPRLAAPGLIAICLFASAADAGRRQLPVRTALDLHLAAPREVDKVEIALPDPGSARAQRRPVSDLLLVATALDARGIDAALTLGNDAPTGLKPLFAVRLLAVSGGRLVRHGQATCRGWLDDASGCRLACDGGRFQLRRQRGEDGVSVRLVLGGAASAEASEALDGRSGLLLSACERDGEAEMRLVPAGGKPSAEIAFSAD